MSVNFKNMRVETERERGGDRVCERERGRYVILKCNMGLHFDNM